MTLEMQAKCNKGLAILEGCVNLILLLRIKIYSQGQGRPRSGASRISNLRLACMMNADFPTFKIDIFFYALPI